MTFGFLGGVVVGPTKMVPYIAFLLFLPFFGCQTPRPEAGERSTASIEASAPELKLTLLNGETVHLSDYRGRLFCLTSGRPGVRPVE